MPFPKETEGSKQWGGVWGGRAAPGQGNGRLPACSGVASHVAQASERPEDRVSVTEVVETELDSRVVAVMNHSNLRGD